MIHIVNIIIPVFHSKETLPKTLDSLVAQTKRLFFVTIVSDGDGEDYSDIVETYSGRGLHIIALYMPTNRGPGMARQYGLDRTHTEYVMFLDSDDVLYPQAVEVLTSEIAKNAYDIVSGHFDVQQDGLYSSTLKEPLKITWVIGKIYRVSYLRANDIRFYETIRLNEDAAFNFLAFNSTKQKGEIPIALGAIRENKNSLTRKDKLAGFMKVGGSDYILGQLLGMARLYETGHYITVPTCAFTLMTVYYHEQVLAYYGLSVNEQTEAIYREYYNHPMYKSYVESEEFWDIISENLRGCMKLDDEYVFFRERFSEWIDRRIMSCENLGS